MKKTLEEIKKYDTFIYDKYEIEYSKNKIKITYYYEIPNLAEFNHILELPVTNTHLNEEYVNNLVFNIGLLELISYWKVSIPHNVVINCGTITDSQKEFFKKVYYHGLGEFFYLNNLHPNYEDFMEITSSGKIHERLIDYQGVGGMICIGGGKDSCVSLSLLSKVDNSCFIINPKQVMLDCAYVAGYNDDEIIIVKRVIDKKLLALNEEGFLNGHTPFSAMVAFVSYLTAYLNNKQSIILSNESSANEANVTGTKINHQYSKSFEFEQDFTDYAQKYLGGNINYHSFLRPLTEYQIGLLFSKYEQYHSIFKSCNRGSKEIPWRWCGACAKCLFVYCLLAPHLYKDKLVNIFGADLFTKEELLTTFQELLGKINVKPFDCVGTFQEINYAITLTIKQLGYVQLPYLLKYYKENYYDETILSLDLEHQYNSENNLNQEEEQIIKESLQL